MADRTVERLHRVLIAAGVPVEGVSIVVTANPATWTVCPPSLQEIAQPIIDAFNPADPAHAAAELSALAQMTSRKKDILTLLACSVRGRNIAGWNAMTAAQRVNATLAEADVFKTIREWLDDKV